MPTFYGCPVRPKTCAPNRSGHGEIDGAGGGAGTRAQNQPIYIKLLIQTDAKSGGPQSGDSGTGGGRPGSRTVTTGG